MGVPARQQRRSSMAGLPTTCGVMGKGSMAKGGSTMEARPRLGRGGMQRKEEGMRLWSWQRARLDGELCGG